MRTSFSKFSCKLLQVKMPYLINREERIISFMKSGMFYEISYSSWTCLFCIYYPNPCSITISGNTLEELYEKFISQNVMLDG